METICSFVRVNPIMEIPVGYLWGVGGGVEGDVSNRLFLLLE